uniref:Non-selective voltage-gated ion channel VDAC1 n=2 Tax=Monodelphis domestica TaxID=13616 RepID=F6UN69_MONDO
MEKGNWEGEVKGEGEGQQRVGTRGEEGGGKGKMEEGEETESEQEPGASPHPGAGPRRRRGPRPAPPRSPAAAASPLPLCRLPATAPAVSAGREGKERSNYVISLHKNLQGLFVISKKMAVPPTYADLGKSARDVFTKGYGFGLIKLDLKTKSENGLEFTSSGSANTETSKVSGSLETKYKWSEYGLTFIEKWNTDNTLGTEITVEDQLARGLKLTFDSSFSPNTGKKNAKIKSGYKREHINLGCDMDFDISGPSIRGAVVLGYEGWLAGYQMNFETSKSRVTQSNFAVGYKTDEFQLHTNVNDGTEFGGSIYQKVNKKLETAVNLAWTAGNSNTRFGIAAKYQIDPEASFSAKVNNSSLIGLGYTQTLKPGIKLTLSALLDGKNVNAGGHKLGLGLEFQA